MMGFRIDMLRAWLVVGIALVTCSCICTGWLSDSEQTHPEQIQPESEDGDEENDGQTANPIPSQVGINKSVEVTLLDSYSSMQIADQDGDSRPDVVLTKLGGGIFVLQNQSSIEQLQFELQDYRLGSTAQLGAFVGGGSEGILPTLGIQTIDGIISLYKLQGGEYKLSDSFNDDECLNFLLDLVNTDDIYCDLLIPSLRFRSLTVVYFLEDGTRIPDVGTWEVSTVFDQPT